jgi:hypothetical protein
MPAYAEAPVRPRPVGRASVARGRRVMVPTFVTTPRAPLPPAYAPAPIRARTSGKVRGAPRVVGSARAVASGDARRG